MGAAPAMLTSEQAQMDFDILRRALGEAHAGLYRFSTPAELNRRFDALRARLNQPLSQLEFIGVVSEMVAAIRCGHTSLNLDEATRAARAAAPRFPIRVQLEQGRLMVMFNDTPDDATILPGMELLSINGRPAKSVVEAILSKIPADGFTETMRPAQLRQSFPSRYWLFVDQSPRFTVQAQDASGRVVTTVLPGIVESERTKNTNPVNATLSANLAKLDGPKDNVALRFLRDPEIAYLRIRSFDVGPDYPQHLEAAFRKLAEKDARVLLLDLRRNGGGIDLFGAALVSYFTDQPFRYFDHIDQTIPIPSFATWPASRVEEIRKGVSLNPAGHGYLVTKELHAGVTLQPPGKFPFLGKVIVLLDGGTFSTAADVCALLYHLRRPTFVGEESGGGYSGNTSGLTTKIALPSSKLEIGIPMWGYWNAVAEPLTRNRGTLPDVQVESKVTDLLYGVDQPLERALQLAEAALAGLASPQAGPSGGTGNN